jgi:hypothetical protein
MGGTTEANEYVPTMQSDEGDTKEDPSTSRDPKYRLHPTSSPERASSSQDPTPRKVLSSHAQIQTFDTPPKGRSARRRSAEEEAWDLDWVPSLDPDESSVTPRKGQGPVDDSPPEVFDYRNARQDLNEILLEEEQERVRRAAVRVVDVLFGSSEVRNYWKAN